MTDRYILDQKGNPVRCDDLDTWVQWFEQSGLRRVAKDEIGDIEISTVFLGLDHAFGGGPPLLWETMIFGGEQDGYQERYSSREAALAGHTKAVALVKGGA